MKYLRKWTKGKRSSLKFGIPVVWREPTNHVTHCCFRTIDVAAITRKNWSLKYPDLESARRPVAHCDETTVPFFGELLKVIDEATVWTQRLETVHWQQQAIAEMCSDSPWQKHNSWFLLDSEERNSCCWAFEGFDENRSSCPEFFTIRSIYIYLPL